MKPITLRNIPADLAEHIRNEARKTGLSLNRTVIGMLRRAAGLAPGGTSNQELACLGGSWSAEEAERFDAALAEQRQVDPAMWE